MFARFRRKYDLTDVILWLIGAVLLTALPQALSTFEGWETVAFGTILMLSMIFMPRGLVPTLAARFGRTGREEG